ncbi:MAG: phage tail protein [Bacteroidota bacterium]
MIETRTSDSLQKLAERFPKAAVSALNKTGARLKTEASRIVRKEYRAKKSGVDKTFKVSKATRDRPVVVFRSTGRRLSLTDFGARQTRTGVTVAMKRGIRIKYPHAFIATMPSGHTGVFIRSDISSEQFKKRKSKSSMRHGLPIIQITGPSVPTILGSQKTRERLTQFVKDTLPALLRHEIEFFGR